MPERDRFWNLLILALGVAFLSWPAELGAQPRSTRPNQGPPAPEVHLGAGSRLYWDPAWAKFDVWDTVVTSGAVALSIAAVAVGPDPTTPTSARLRFDERTRNVLRAKSQRGRLMARDVSDVLVGIVGSYPVIGDALIDAAWYRDSPDVGAQLTLIYFEAAAVTAATVAVTKAMVGRQRPFGRTCGDELPDDTWDCLNRTRYFSHFSGHASTAFSAASVSCAYHQTLPLAPTQAPWAPCAIGYSLAATSALLRVVADQHYVSDIAVGALAGTAVGWLVPWLHFHGTLPAPAGAEGLSWTLSPTSNGVVATGVF